MSEDGQLKTCRFQLSRVIENNRILCEAINLAEKALEDCVDDRHYAGCYPRHTEVLEKIKALKEKLP
jgi:hypothetical protein